jgi:hypothetical protein
MDLQREARDHTQVWGGQRRAVESSTLGHDGVARKQAIQKSAGQGKVGGRNEESSVCVLTFKKGQVPWKGTLLTGQWYELAE